MKLISKTPADVKQPLAVPAMAANPETPNREHVGINHWWPHLPAQPVDWELTSTFLSRPLVALLFYPVRTQASPNIITLVSLLTGVVGAWLLLLDQWVNWGLSFLFLAMLFDDADGQLARYQGCSSRLGSFFDKSVDVVRFGLLFSIIGVLAFRESGSVMAAMAGPLAAFGLMVQGYTKWLTVACMPCKNTEETAKNAPSTSTQISWLRGVAIALLWPFHECDLTLWVCIFGVFGQWTVLVWVLCISQLAAGMASVAARLAQVYAAEKQ